jgi:DNA-binding GntR family transcriptional regulator
MRTTHLRSQMWLPRQSRCIRRWAPIRYFGFSRPRLQSWNIALVSRVVPPSERCTVALSGGYNIGMPLGANASSRKDLPSRLKLQTAPEAAAQAIRDSIIGGRLKPGERIVEQQWASLLGIGQPTLREALKELEFQGLVSKKSNRGTYVTQLKTDDYRKLLEVRLPLEVLAIEQAALRMDEAAASELTAVVEELVRSAENMDIAAFHDADVAFHRRIWEMAGNEYLRLCLETVSLRLFVFSVLDRGTRLPVESRAAAEQHKGILAGLLSGDAKKAREAYLNHTARYWNAHYSLELVPEATFSTVPR